MDYRQQNSEEIFQPLNEVLQALLGGLMSHQSSVRLAEVFDDQAEILARITADASPGPAFTVTAEHLVAAFQELAIFARGGAWLNAMLIEDGLLPPLPIEQEMKLWN